MLLPGDPPAQVMLLGTFHFHNPGLDAYKPQHQPDMLSEPKQREIAEVLDRLARYGPTRICVEQNRDHQATVDQDYASYRAGAFQLTANEIHQIGFRLAARLGLERLHAIDAWGRMYESFEAVEAYAKFQGPDQVAIMAGEDPWHHHFFDGYRRADEHMPGTTLREVLLGANDERNVLQGHGAYLVSLLELGGEADYTGPDLISGWWYNRNLRIWRNIQRATAAGDRILVVIGSGHLPVLRHCAQTSPQHELVEVAAYLS